MSIRSFAGLCLIVAICVPAYGAGCPCKGRGGAAPRTGTAHRGGQSSQGGKPADVTGMVAGMGGGAIQIQSATNQPTLAYLTPMTAVRLSGTATADFLRNGLCIEFVADVPKSGVAKEKVGQLTIFTPSPSRQLGIFPASVAAGAQKTGAATDAESVPVKIGGDQGIARESGDKPARKGGKTRGKAAGAENALAGGLDALGGGAAKKDQAGVQLGGVVTVRGQIKSCRNGSISVSLGRGSMIRFELTDSPQIGVDLSDCSLAMRGDRIHVKGKSLPQPNAIAADSVQIEGAQPYSGKRHSSAHSAKTDKPATKSAKKAKTGGDAGDKAPDEAGEKTKEVSGDGGVGGQIQKEINARLRKGDPGPGAAKEQVEVVEK